MEDVRRRVVQAEGQLGSELFEPCLEVVLALAAPPAALKGLLGVEDAEACFVAVFVEVAKDSPQVVGKCVELGVCLDCFLCVAIVCGNGCVLCAVVVLNGTN